MPVTKSHMIRPVIPPEGSENPQVEIDEKQEGREGSESKVSDIGGKSKINLNVKKSVNPQGIIEPVSLLEQKDLQVISLTNENETLKLEVQELKERLIAMERARESRSSTRASGSNQDSQDVKTKSGFLGGIFS